MWLFDAILKDEAYENSATQLQADTLAANDKSGGVRSGGGGGGGSGDGSGWGGSWSWSGGSGDGSGWFWDGSGWSGTGNGTSWSGGSGNGGGIIIMDSTPLVSATDASISDPMLNIAEEPLVMMDDGNVVGTVPAEWASILTATMLAPEPSIFDEVSPAAEAKGETSDPLAVVAAETPETVAGTPEESVVPEIAPVLEPMVPEVTPVVAPEPAKMLETSPIEILEESIDKLKKLEDEAKMALEGKNKEDEDYKDQINELKWLDKIALQEASKIESDIEHIEEIITTFSKELDKEKGIVEKEASKK